MTSKTRFGVACSMVLLAAWLFASAARADKGTKVKAYKAQTTHSFANSETEPVFGLKVVLSTAGEVKTEDESSQAGPFRDIRGNGTNTIELTNSKSPMEPGSDEIDLVFGTYQKKIKVDSWWWLDEKGKRVGKKKKG